MYPPRSHLPSTAKGTYPLLRHLVRRVRGLAFALSATGALLFVSSAPAAAYEPVGIVHTEQVQAGPYRVTVGFSEWPLRAMQSLDFTFVPEGGIAGKSGHLTIAAPGMDADEADAALARHPRKRDVWGLDVLAMAEPGRSTFTFDVNGPEGRGKGTLQGVPVLEQPGPPLSLSWTACALPVLGMVTFLGVGWRRNKPSERVASLVA